MSGDRSEQVDEDFARALPFGRDANGTNCEEQRTYLSLPAWLLLCSVCIICAVLSCSQAALALGTWLGTCLGENAVFCAQNAKVTHLVPTSKSGRAVRPSEEPSSVLTFAPKRQSSTRTPKSRSPTLKALTLPPTQMPTQRPTAPPTAKPTFLPSAYSTDDPTYTPSIAPSMYASKPTSICFVSLLPP